MHRLLAEIRSHTLEKRYRAGSGLERRRYSLRARVVGSAADALKPPERVVGKETSLTRDYLVPWAPRKGDLLVLSPGESARLLRSGPACTIDRVWGDGAVRSEFVDCDRDGLREDVAANAFARAVVSPSRGARLSSLEGADGEDRFAHSHEYVMAGKYVMLGGVEPMLLEAGSPGDVWKSAFERTAGDDESEAFDASYALKLESPKGVRLTKTVRMEPWLPGVLETYRVRYAGKPAEADGSSSGARAGGEGASGAGSAGNGETRGKSDSEGKRGRGAGDKKDETDVTFGLRAFTAVRGDVPSLNVFEIPCSDGVHVVRFHPPAFGRRWRWRDWRDEHFGVRGGIVVSRNEVEGGILAILVNERRFSHAYVKPDFSGPELGVVHRTRKLGKGRSAAFGAAILVGSAVALGQGSMLLGTLGAPRRGRVPLALTVRGASVDGRVRARVDSGDGRRTVSLARRHLQEVGDVNAAVLEVRRRSLPISVSARVGGESLALTIDE